jgi:Carboxypeptidase regulatory-like domain
MVRCSHWLRTAGLLSALQSAWLACGPIEPAPAGKNESAEIQDTLGVSRAALTYAASPAPGVRVGLAMRIPAEVVAPEEVAISAREAISIGHAAKVIGRKPGKFGALASFGSVGGGGEKTHLGESSQVGHVWSQPLVHVNPRGEIHGNVKTASTIKLLQGASVTGTTQQNMPVGYRDVERAITLPTGNGEIVIVGAAQTRRLTPGYYKQLKVLTGGRLDIAPGTYYVESFEAQTGSLVAFQNAENPVTIYIRDALTYQGRVTEQATGDQVGGVLWGYAGSQTVRIATPLVGTIVSPAAEVKLEDDGGAAPYHLGAVFARRVSLAPGKVLTHAPFPALLIDEVRVSKTTPCLNEPFTVEVDTAEVAPGQGNAISVMLNGAPGIKHIFAYQSAGDYEIRASAFKDGMASGRTVRVHVQQCGQEVFPRLALQASHYAPYTVEFNVMNAADLQGPGRTFNWDFGDGTTAQSTTPFIEHSYLAMLDATTKSFALEATLVVTRDGLAPAITRRTVNFSNYYAETRGRGYARPPVTGDAYLRRVGGGLRGSFSIRNLENEAISLGSIALEQHFCDPDLDPVAVPADHDVWRVGALTPGQPLVIPALGTTTQELAVAAKSFGSNVCALSVHLSGTTSTGLAIRVSVHLDTPEPGLFATPVADSGLRTLLNQAASSGLVADPNHIDERELLRLWKQGLLPEYPGIGDVEDGALPAGEIIGSRCDPEAIPSHEGITCQATDEWTLAPPLVRNALKGDIFISAGCGEIGALLRVVTPRQLYSHEAIMTRNYYSLSHTTASSSRIVSSVGQSVRNRMDDDMLKHAWPGAVHASVNAGFNGRQEVAPDGKIWKIAGFASNATQCQGDAALNPPIVIRPVPGSDASIRSKLHEAADIAGGIKSHYRFFGYSQSNIAFVGGDNFDGRDYRDSSGGLAQVSTTFIWHALKSAGITLEGAEIETEDQGVGAMPPTGKGIIDGLYLYTEAERREGAKQIYSSTYSSVKDVHEDNDILPWLQALLTIVPPGVWTDQADEIASQFTNCFANDSCGGDAAESRDYENPGAGVAVSPDNFRFWDSPAEGGVFGDEELLIYRAADYRRIHRWSASASSGSVRGSVTFPDGTAVLDAVVTVAGQDTASDATGSFAFPAVPQGSYEVRAEKQVLRSDHNQPCPENGSQLCNNLVDVELVTVTAGEELLVDLVLEPETATPPPTLEVFARRVEFSGEAHLHNDDVIGSTNEDFDLTAHCDVSPLSRDVRVKIPYQRICAGDEVVLDLFAHCTLEDDNETVRVVLDADLREGSGCGTKDPADHDVEGPIMLPACSDPSDPDSCLETVSMRLENSGVGGGDYASFDLHMRNVRFGDPLELPNVQSHNLRKVTFFGEIELIDDEVFGSQSQSYVLGEECIVDPFDPEQTVSWKQCVGGEVRLELKFSCSLAADYEKVNVKLEAKLFEGATCITDDQEAERTREWVIEPCNGSCVPFQHDFSLDNSDKDKANVSLQIVNEQR